MAKVNLVNKRIKMELSDIIKYQLLTHCYVNRIYVTESDLKCMTLLALSENNDLTDFCEEATNQQIFKSTQTVRNCIVKLEKIKLIIKEGKNKKKIKINPGLKIQTRGNILLDYKIAHVGSD